MASAGGRDDKLSIPTQCFILGSKNRDQIPTVKDGKTAAAVSKFGTALAIAAGSIAWTKTNLSSAGHSQKNGRIGQRGLGESL
jgi:hypothetical protein